jgi:hypothetical protein
VTGGAENKGGDRWGGCLCGGEVQWKGFSDESEVFGVMF